MAFFESLRTSISRIDSHRFFQYLMIGFSLVLISTGGIIFQFYRSTNSLKKRIGRVNQLREQAQDILERANDVIMQRSEVDRLLTEDIDFKLGGYFKDVLEKLQLAQKEKMETTQTTEREDNYLEQVLNAKFVDMNMKELTTLLAKIESNPRIYTQELEVKRSEKISGTIDVTLVVATLVPLAVPTQ